MVGVNFILFKFIPISIIICPLFNGSKNHCPNRALDNLLLILQFVQQKLNQRVLKQLNHYNYNFFSLLFKVLAILCH